MNIAINGRFLTQQTTGVQRYAMEVVRAIDRLVHEGRIDKNVWRFVVLAPRNTRINLRLRELTIKTVGVLQGHLWEQLELPFYARGALLISLGNAGPLMKRKQLITIHDAAVRAIPDGRSLAFRILYTLLMPMLCRFSGGILTVSQFSKRELIRYYGVQASRVSVVSEGCEHITEVPSDTSIFQRYGIARRSYVLAVSTLNPNKNFALVVRAIELMNAQSIHFIIAGGTDPRIFAASSRELLPNAKHIGYVTDGELKALYEGAICLVYPSLYEGFGLPPLEAMACGCPVIVSREASLPEVCGDAALYCDAHDASDLAAKIQGLVANQESQRVLRSKGLARSREFTWHRSALEHLKQISEMIG